MTTALRHSAFRRLLLGLAASQPGDWLYNTALLAYVFERTHSATWLGVTTAARVLPVVVLGPLGGVIADRFDRRRLMVLADLAGRGSCSSWSRRPWALPVVLVPVLAARPRRRRRAYPACAAASVARLVPDEELAAANAARAIVGPVCIVAGPALGALVVALSSADVAFALNAATFAVSASPSLRCMPAPIAFHPAAQAETPNVVSRVA